MRRALALLLSFLLTSNAAANPLAYVLSSQEAAPEITDPAASSARESAGEPASEGELDSLDLSKLASRLTMIALGYESFRHEAYLDANSAALVDYTSPQGLIPKPADRAHTLDRLYRALALVDYTQALRYAEGEGCARAARRTLLRSPDGLFADPKTGELSSWLKAELKRAKAADAPGNLVAASAREWTPLAYLKTLAEVRAASRLLADEKILGSERAAAYCRRANLYEGLSSAQATLKWSDPALPSNSVVEVRWGKEKGAGTVLLHDGKPVVLVSGKFTENEYETPDLFANSGRNVSASYLRRGPVFSLLSVRPAADLAPLPFPETTEEGEQVAYAVGHPIQGGPWSVTRGLSRPEGGALLTDAAIDEAQAGGPLFDAQGRLIGIVAGRGAAYDLKTVKSWLETSQVAFPQINEAAPELGTGALLTASGTFAPKEPRGLIEAQAIYIPPGKCVDPRGCDPTPRPPSSSGGSTYAPSAPNPYAGCPPTQCYPAFMAPIMGLFGLFKSRPKRQVHIQDNRRQNAPTQSAPRAAPRPPEPPKNPLLPSHLELRLDKTTAARGETIEATVTMTFTGEEGTRAGRYVTFEAEPKGLAVFEPRTATTDGGGVARARIVLAAPSEDSTRFDELTSYEAKMRGVAVGEAIAPLSKPGDAVGEVKARERKHGGDLDREALKYPEAANGPSAGESPESVRAPAIDGRDLIITARSGRLNTEAGAVILDKRCPPGTAAQPLEPENVAPGEPARGDTPEKLRKAACREIDREAKRACGEDAQCVAAERVNRGYVSMGCDEVRTRMPAYDLGSPPTWLPRARKPEPRYECVSTDSAAAKAATYRSEGEAKPENTSPGHGATPPTQEALIARIWAILKPDGHRWAGEKSGNAILMRMSGSGEDLIKATKSLFDKLTDGMKIEPHPRSEAAAAGGRRAKLGDVTISYRSDSHSGPPTIDVKVPGQNPFKVKFINDP